MNRFRRCRLPAVRPPRGIALSCAAAALCGAVATARAEPLIQVSDEMNEPPDTLEFRPWRDGIITGLGAAFWLLEETAFKDAFAPDKCRWCDRDADGTDTLNGLDASVRNAIHWSHIN